MPVVGFHQARRPRMSAGERLRRELSWPRPGGVLVSLAGAALVLAGVAVLPPTGSSPQAAGPHPGTTPGASSAPDPTSSSAPLGATVPPSPAPPPVSSAATSPAMLNPSGGSSTAIPLSQVVKGAGRDSAIEKLFSSGAGGASDPGLLDITNPASQLVLVNKQRALAPANYAPQDLVAPAVRSASTEATLLRSEAAGALERMFSAATADGVAMTVKSSYRSYETQVGVYNGYVADKGMSAADTTSARPGHSEHQTGLALDIGDANAGTACDFNSCFADTAAAKWVAAHGAEHGWIVRYQPGEESTTGYLAEPWHLRYVGPAVALDMAVRGIASYEGYLGLPAAPDYH